MVVSGLGWMTQITPAELRDLLGRETVRRGEAYASDGRVVSLAHSAQRVIAKVRGSRNLSYTVILNHADADADADSGRDLPSSGRPRDWVARCTCPLQVDCKHVAAVIVTLQNSTRAAQPSAASAGAPTKSLPTVWESAFGPLASPDVSPVAHGALPLGLQVIWHSPISVRVASSMQARVQLRPMVPGKRGGWIKTGVSWSDLLGAYQRVAVVPEHRDALVEIALSMQVRHRRQYYSGSDVSVFIDAVGPHVWRLLDQAVQAGVQLVAESPHDPDPVLIPEPASVVVDFRREHPTGTASDTDPPGIGVFPQLLVAGEPQPTTTLAWVGNPAHGLVIPGTVRGSLHLQAPSPLRLVALDRPLDPAVRSLLTYTGDVRIPAADEQRFLAGYYPTVARRATVTSSDGSVDFPCIHPPRLGVLVDYGSNHQVQVSWVFRYRVGESVHAVPLVDESVGAGSVERDPYAEQALLAGVDFLPRLPTDLDWREPGSTRLVANRQLTGMDTARFTTEVLPVLQSRDDLDVVVSGTPAEYRLADQAPVIAIGATDRPAGGSSASLPASDGDPGDWFNLSVQVTVAGEQVPYRALFAALARHETTMLLESGMWFNIDIPELQSLRRLIDEARDLGEAADGGLRLSRYQVGLWEELVKLGVVAEQSERWRRSVAGLLGVNDLPQPPPPAGLLATLRPYQVQGYHWLSFIWDQRLGGILADDMGLGKTVQILAMASRAHQAAELKDPLLIVVPTSVVPTWVAEAARFTPDLQVATLIETTRRSGRSVADVVAGAQVVITTYAVFRLDYESFEQVPWSGLVLDEAQFVKNHQAKTYRCARALPAVVKIAITGTPLENSLMDVWALLSITAPGLFPDPQVFTERYRRPIESGSEPELLATLRQRVRPLMLRRTKNQVAQDLPEKQEQVLRVALEPAHRRLYDKRLARERQKVLGLLDDMKRNRFAILRSLTVLRQLSLDPMLTEDPPPTAAVSSKIDTLVEYVHEISAEGHRCLVFSQFTGFLALIRSRLEAEGIDYCYLDGKTRNRSEVVTSFTEGDQPVFLISLKAGGFGLTLTQADYVFVMDPWWNPATEAQAIDRTHRIGQTKKVNVYRLVAADTIEEKVVALQERKRDLFTSVMDDGNLLSTPLTPDDIRGLLG